MPEGDRDSVFLDTVHVIQQNIHKIEIQVVFDNIVLKVELWHEENIKCLETKYTMCLKNTRFIFRIT